MHSPQIARGTSGERAHVYWIRFTDNTELYHHTLSLDPTASPEAIECQSEIIGKSPNINRYEYIRPIYRKKRNNKELNQLLQKRYAPSYLTPCAMRHDLNNQLTPITHFDDVSI